MPELSRSLLPNILTVARILIAPVVFFLALVPAFGPRLLAFVLFLVAAFSDLVDGYLARKYGWISNFGKVMDPLADKLLMVATLVPLYMLSNPLDPFTEWPIWGRLPLWVVLIIFIREITITVIRMVVAKRGRFIPAGKAGKHKAFSQNFFVGTGLFWYALHSAAATYGWTGPLWEGWRAFHGAVLAVTLLIAVALTIYSLAVYLFGWATFSQPDS